MLIKKYKILLISAFIIILILLTCLVLIKRKEVKNLDLENEKKNSIILSELDKTDENSSNKSNENMKILKEYYGEWEVVSLLYRDRERFSRESDESDRKLIGKRIVINEDTLIFLNNEKYICDTIETLNLNDFGNRYDMIWSEIETLGENIVDIGLKKSENNMYANFGLIIDSQKNLYMFGGEWFNDRGIYLLSRVK